MALEGDSLLTVDLSETVRQETLAVQFTTKVLRNATVFGADLGSRQRPGLWQSVEAAERNGNIVYLPALADSDRLIGDLAIEPAVFTPNGDGVNDGVEIRFAVFKVDQIAAKVEIFDLAGRRVAQLEGRGQGLQRFTWNGRDQDGNLVAPGLYLCHINVGADSGDNVVTRTLSVAY